jgi:L-rhamnose mutarotase
MNAIPKRFGQIIRVKPEKLDDYIELHKNPWPCVLERLRKSNIGNYSIFLAPGDILFAYFEYYGQDLDADLRLIAEDPCTQKWWKETDPCQQSMDPDGKNQWLDLREVFHLPAGNRG